jgi:hypothetical protein
MSMEMVAQVRDFSKSRGDAKFLLLTIASHINPQLGWAWPSLETLAHEITKGKPYTIKLIRALEALGELEVRRGHGRGHANHYRVTIWHEPPRARSAPANPDQPKGNPSDDHFPEEKVSGRAEKVIEDPEKGNPSGYSKERLERKDLETGAREKVIEDVDEWIMKNAIYGTHLACGADHQPGTPCYLLPRPEDAAGAATG